MNPSMNYTIPLHIRHVAHAICDPHFGQPSVEAFTRVGALVVVQLIF